MLFNYRDVAFHFVDQIKLPRCTASERVDRGRTRLSTGDKRKACGRRVAEDCGGERKTKKTYWIPSYNDKSLSATVIIAWHQCPRRTTKANPLPRLTTPLRSLDDRPTELSECACTCRLRVYTDCIAIGCPLCHPYYKLFWLYTISWLKWFLKAENWTEHTMVAFSLLCPRPLEKRAVDM